MLLHLPDVLSREELAWMRERLAAASWSDGRATSGAQSAEVKRNLQLPESSEVLHALQPRVLAALERQPLFFSATLPARISPPMFNRYGGDANFFGNHIDSAVRRLRDGQGQVRTDVSCTLFLCDPQEYDGGELVIEEPGSVREVKLPAGHMVVYPATTLHRVEPVTRGERWACFFWIQSMVRSQEQRRLLFDMDQHLMRLRTALGETDPSVVGLTGTYHNLLRQWVQT